MGFQDFIESNGVENIDPVFAEVFDDVGPAILQLSYKVTVPVVPPAPPPATPIPPLALAQPIVAGVAAKTGADPSKMSSLLTLVSAIETDINTLVIPVLIAGSVSLNLRPAPGPPAPAPPIAPIALGLAPTGVVPPIPQVIPNALKFAKAALEWAVSFLESDHRIANPIEILPLAP